MYEGYGFPYAFRRLPGIWLQCYRGKSEGSYGKVSAQRLYPGASDEAEVHKRIYHLTQMYPGQIFGVASVNPHMDEKQYKAKIRKYITEYHFKAVKLHTIGHAVHPF